jgi:putative major outer membrane protein P.IA
MKKLHITFAAALLCAAAAHAETTNRIGGRIFSAIEYESDGDGNATTTFSDLNSRLWIMGSEKVSDNGLTLIYGLNSFVAHDYNGWATDDSYIGLRGSLGTVRVGRMSTPVHYMTGHQDEFEGNNYTQTMGRMTRFGNRAISVVYDSVPKKGFSYRLMAAPGYNNPNYNDPGYPTKTAQERNGKWIYGAGFDYTHAKGFNAHYGMEYAVKASPDAEKDRQVHSLKIGYDKDKFSIGAGFQYAHNTRDRFYYADPETKTANTKDFQITTSYKLGNFTPQIGVAYGRSNSGKNYKQLALQTRYDFSKSTFINLGAGLVKESRDKKNWRAVGLSMTHNIQ